jgi:hypothetical protein
MTYSAYIDAGESNPKVQLLEADETTILSTITFAPTTPREGLSFSPMRPSPPQWTPEYENTGETVDGELVRKIKGFRFTDSLNFPVIDKTSAGQVKAILSHPYRIKYYPHSDFARYYIVMASGGVTYLNQTGTLPMFTASLQVVAVYLCDTIPHFYAIQRALEKATFPAGYTDAEKAYQMHALEKASFPSGYTTAEQAYTHLPEGSLGDNNYSL